MDCDASKVDEERHKPLSLHYSFPFVFSVFPRFFSPVDAKNTVLKNLC